MENTPVITDGTKVYYDSFCGLIAAKVVRYYQYSGDYQLQITARNSNVFSCGELIWTTHNWIVSRNVKVRSGNLIVTQL